MGASSIRQHLSLSQGALSRLEHCGRIVESHVAIDAEVYGGEVPACQVVSGGQFSRAIYRGRGLGHIITHVIRQGSQGSMLGFDFTSTLLGSR